MKIKEAKKHITHHISTHPFAILGSTIAEKQNFENIRAQLSLKWSP